jgi:hypothetical protein
MALAAPGQNNKYQVYPFYSGSDSACTNAIYLLPPSWKAYGQAFAPFTIPLLYGGPSDALPAAVSTGDFTVAFTATGKAPYNQGNVNVTVTIGANAWACAPATRQTLRQNFTGLLLALEAGGALVAGGVQVVASQIAECIPAPLAETLFWRYSLSPGTDGLTAPYVDLRPGMRLRVDGEVSQFVNPGSPQNGYVGASSMSFQLGSAGAGDGPRTVSFEPLLGAIRAPTVSPPTTTPVVTGPSPAGTAVAAGALDLEPTGGQRAYWRLLYPASVPSPLDPGDVAIRDNVTLLGAPSLAELEKATADYPKSLDTSDNPPNVYVTFLGRALAVPEIGVFITLGTGPRWLEWVPLGTTLANIVERFTPLPLSPTQTAVSGFQRPTFAAPNPQPTAPVSFTVTDPAGNAMTALPPAMFDVPLIAGDSVVLNV